MTSCDCVEGCQLADRFTPATREILIFTKSKKRYFDLDAVREPFKPHGGLATGPKRQAKTDGGWSTLGEWTDPNPAGAPPLDWWNLPWGQVHNRLVRAMVPERVCRECGEPSRRIVEVSEKLTATADARIPAWDRGKLDSKPETMAAHLRRDGFIPNHQHDRTTLGFSDCGHNSWRPGVVLDPFQPGDEMTATFHVGDAIETMNKLPEKSVDLILTSPPFLALRSYLPADHPDKTLEGGSQATPGQYIDWLIDVVEACDRVLAPHGSMCIELGDTYSGSTLGFTSEDASNGYDTPGRQRQAQDPRASKTGSGWPLAKSLSLIPELFRLTLVYGTNPLTGRTTDRWRLRNVVRWVRPNPPVGALGDKFRPATSELMVFCKSAKRYFDLDSVREPARMVMGRNVPGNNIKGSDDRSFRFAERVDSNPAGAPPLDWWNIPLLEGEEPTKGGPKAKGYDPEERRQRAVQQTTNHGGSKEARQDFGEAFYNAGNPLGAPPLDWWNIPPGGYEGAHYAVFPPELCIKPIKAMCPERVCKVCGEPQRRETEREPYWVATGERTPGGGRGDGIAGLTRAMIGQTGSNAVASRVIAETWTDCGHDDWRPGLVLDPFGGSGTTALVATGHGRDCVLIDLDERNYELALQRVGPFILERAG